MPVSLSYSTETISTGRQSDQSNAVFDSNRCLLPHQGFLLHTKCFHSPLPHINRRHHNQNFKASTKCPLHTNILLQFN